jgi:hypothetical protein
LHLSLSTTWTRTMMGKMWIVQVSELKVSGKLSSRETMPTRETITTMRTWVVTKASRHEAVLS